MDSDFTKKIIIGLSTCLLIENLYTSTMCFLCDEIRDLDKQEIFGDVYF